MGHEPKGAADVRTRFREAGFEVADVPANPHSFAVKKDQCTHLIAQIANGAWTIAGRPAFNVRGLDCELEDRGYQKFWYHLGRRFPVRVNDLKTLHHFDEEVRTLLGAKTLYHESLGSTSARTAYDRLYGRADD